MAPRFLIDNSAWVRLAEPGAGYYARSGRDYDGLLTELRALPHFVIDAEVEARALRTQNELARAAHHRLPPVDILVAAIADRYGVGVLHYDRDYDLVKRTTVRSYLNAYG